MSSKVESPQYNPEAANTARPEAPEGGGLYDTSQKLYENYRDLLPEGYGVVASFKMLSRPDGELEKPAEMIVFDARGRDIGRYAWQVSYGGIDGLGSRRMWQLELGPEVSTCLMSETTVQGAISKSAWLSPVELAEFESSLLARLSSPEISDFIQAKRQERAEAEKRLQLKELSGAEDDEIRVAKLQVRLAVFAPFPPYELET